MRSFWDTSAAINALVSPTVGARLQTGEHFARLHLLSEFFSIMTGRGIAVTDKQGNVARLVMSQKDAAIWLRNFARKVTFIELTRDETLDALDRAQKKHVQGGRVYDYLHALAADKAAADELLTRDAGDFKGLGKIAVVWP